MAIPSIEDLMGAEVGSGDFPLLPAGIYNGVITKSDVGHGPKAPYIKVMVTIHDEEYKGWTVWGNSTLSESALTMPGAAPNLVQSTGIKLELDTDPKELPNVIASSIISKPVQVEVTQDQVKRNGKLQYNDDDSPEMRASIKKYFEAPEEFIESIELEAQGVDEDLPF